jgi:hypothetical protein
MSIPYYLLFTPLFLGIAYNIPMLMLLRLRNFPPTFVAQMAKKGEPMDHTIRNGSKPGSNM